MGVASVAGSDGARQKCNAKSKQTQQRCRQWPVPGKDKCHYHGGSHPIKHGLYSKYRGGPLGDRIARLRQDPELLSLERQAAISQALQELALEHFEALEAALASPAGPDAMREIVKAPDTLETLRKLTETSAKIISRHQGTASGDTVPLGLLMMVIDRFIHALNQHILEPATRREIVLQVTRGLDLGEALGGH